MEAGIPIPFGSGSPAAPYLRYQAPYYRQAGEHLLGNGGTGDAPGRYAEHGLHGCCGGPELQLRRGHRQHRGRQVCRHRCGLGRPVSGRFTDGASPVYHEGWGGRARRPDRRFQHDRIPVDRTCTLNIAETTHSSGPDPHSFRVGRVADSCSYWVSIFAKIGDTRSACGGG